MSDTAEKVAQMRKQAMSQLNEVGVSNIDEGRLDGHLDRLKTMVNNQDAMLVSGTDPAELETVRKNFVEKKLGVADKDKGMNAINAVAEKMSGIRMKNRVAFYYLVEDRLS